MPPMRRVSLPSSSVVVLVLAASLVAGCAWGAYVPGEPPPFQEVVVDPSTLAERLALGSAYVGELSCFAPRCQKRFRVVAPESGRLAVRLLPSLQGIDAEVRMVVEGSQEVLGQARSVRGGSADVTVLSVAEPVEAGTYFVLLQTLGGPMRYELLATLAPGEGPEDLTYVDPRLPERPKRPIDPPPKKVELGRLHGGVEAAYDPATNYERHTTFLFPQRTAPADQARPGMEVEQPVDREVRRYIAEALRLKGLRPAEGSEPADLLVDFSTNASTRVAPPLPFLQDWYGVGGARVPLGGQVDAKARFTVDIIEGSTYRLAWHATVERRFRPQVSLGPDSEAMLREAVADLLAPYPPR